MSMLTRESIRKMTQDVTFKRGLQIYYSKNRVTEFNVTEQRGTGRRAMMVRDVVTARVRLSAAENCKVRLEYDRDSELLITSSCDCLAFTNGGGLCKHCVAVLLKYADWRVKQGLYTRPEGNYSKIDEAAPAPAEEQVETGSAAEQGGQPDGGITLLQQLTMPVPSAEAYVPKELTSPLMKNLLEKRTRTRTAPVTEPVVYGRVRIEPVLHLSPAGDKVEFRIGADRMYVMKDTGKFKELMATGQSHSYGKNLTFTHTLDSIAPESRGIARFVMSHAGPPALGVVAPAASRLLTLDGEALEELLFLCEENGIHVAISAGQGQESSEALWQAGEGWPEHPLRLTGEYSELAESLLPSKILGVRGTTSPFQVRVGREYLFAFKDYEIFRMPRERAEAIEDWLKSLVPRQVKWDGEPQRVRHEFFIERTDLPAFCRELLPQLKRVFEVEQFEFHEDDYEMARGEYHFYLDSPEKDVVTCRVIACYGDREYALYRGLSADRGYGLADRDLVDELSLWQALAAWLPMESASAGVSERLLANDEAGLYAFLTEGVNALQELGTVYVSDALRKISVRTAPKVSVGVSLGGDMLNLSMDAEGITQEELAEILSRYDKKKKFHRLKNGDFIQLEEEDMEALADLQQGLGLTSKDMLQDTMEIPRYRALYLDKQMVTGAMDGILVDRTREFKNLVKDMRTVDDNDFEVPSSLNDIMRSYQKHGFLWLKTLASNGFGGILADDMGLGKTLQVISFLLSEHEEREAAAAAAAAEDVGGVSANGTSNSAEKCQKRPTLIICPASLLYNWVSEIQKFAPALKTRLIVGGAPEREQLIKGILPDEDEVCITSYDMMRRDLEHYENIRFGVQVIDEAQYIKNHYTKAARAVKKIRASFKVALTGTPIENRLSELWSIFDYMMPGFLYSYDQFSKQYEKPIVSNQDSAVTERLQRMISPFVLRRLKKDVLRDLPDKIEENLIIPMEGEQRELYDAQVQELRMMLKGQDEAAFRQERFAVLAALTRLRQLCCDPGLLYDGYRGSVSKVDSCMELIGSVIESGHKMLIFSQFTSLLEVLEKRLASEGVEFYKIEGSTPPVRRMELVDAFNSEENPVKVFLISLKAGGTGLNLTAADVVIHFDPWWNKAVENQATDRVHRIGQKNVVNVYKLIAQNTIEENIVKLQEKKRQLAESILGGDEVGTGTFSRDDLLEILGGE